MFAMDLGSGGMAQPELVGLAGIVTGAKLKPGTLQRKIP
jgi:hypothetical protein